MNGRRYHGFTALEVLPVTLGLVALPLIVNGMVRNSVYGENSRRATCQSNLKQVALGYMQYSQDYDERLPVSGRVTKKTDKGWGRGLEPYVKSVTLFTCPSDKFVQDTKVGSVQYTDYYFNSNLAHATMTENSNLADVILTGEGEPASSNYSCANLSSCTGLSKYGRVGKVPRMGKERHTEGANYAFGDGHIKWFKPYKILAKQGRPGQPTFLSK